MAHKNSKTLSIKLVLYILLFSCPWNGYAISRYFTFDRGELTDSLLMELCEKVIYPIAKENNIDWTQFVLCIHESNHNNSGSIIVNLEAGLNVLTFYDNKQPDMDYVIVPIQDMDVQVYLPKHYGLVKKTGGKKVVEDYHYDNWLPIVSDWRIYWKFDIKDGKCVLKEVYDSSEDFLRRYIYQAVLPPSLRMTKLDESIRSPQGIFEIIPQPTLSAPSEINIPAFKGSAK